KSTPYRTTRTQRAVMPSWPRRTEIRGRGRCSSATDSERKTFTTTTQRHQGTRVTGGIFLVSLCLGVLVVRFWDGTLIPEVPMRPPYTRRALLRLAAALPVGSFLPYRALAAAHQGKVKITAIKAMALKNIAGNCLIRIDTDAGLTGYGEAGATGAM